MQRPQKHFLSRQLPLLLFRITRQYEGRHYRRETYQEKAGGRGVLCKYSPSWGSYMYL